MSVELIVGIAIVVLLTVLLIGFQLGRREGMCQILDLMSRPESPRQQVTVSSHNSRR